MKIKIFYPYLRFTNLLFLLILFNACSKTDDPTDFGDIEFNGSYNLTITGDESRTIIGESNFLHVVNSSESQGGMGAILTISLHRGRDGRRGRGHDRRGRHRGRGDAHRERLYTARVIDQHPDAQDAGAGLPLAHRLHARG